MTQSSGCPHDRIEHCPLYVAAHDARLSTVGCIEYLPLEMRCKVETGRWKYQTALSRATRRAFAVDRERLLG